MSRKKWTKIEEDILIEQVQKNAHNLKKAFRNTSEMTGRTEKACELHWYKSILVKKNPEICFVTISKKSSNINRKIIKENAVDTSSKTKRTLWERIVNYFKK